MFLEVTDDCLSNYNRGFCQLVLRGNVETLSDLVKYSAECNWLDIPAGNWCPSRQRQGKPHLQQRDSMNLEVEGSMEGAYFPREQVIL